MQRGEHPKEAKRLKGDLAGLIELRDEFDGDAYRAVYTVRLAGAVYVLHVFQKKSTRGIAMPRGEIALIQGALRSRRAHHAAHYGTPGDAK